MEKVIRVCEITGEVSTVATNLTTDEAKALIKRLAKGDEYAHYARVVPKD